MAEVTVAWKAAAETSACRMVIMMCYMCCVRHRLMYSLRSFYVIVMQSRECAEMAWQLLRFDLSIA